MIAAGCLLLVILPIVGLVVVGSILIHGVAATPVMAHLDRVRERQAVRLGRGTDATPV